MISQLREWIKAMYDITPNDGAYFNEVRPVRLLVDVHLSRSTGVPVRDRLAGDLFWLTLSDSQGNQGHL